MWPRSSAHPTCAHCGMPVIGFAEVDDQVLCNPRVGLRCFDLVMQYGHAMPCAEQSCVFSAQFRRLREAPA